MRCAAAGALFVVGFIPATARRRSRRAGSACLAARDDSADPNGVAIDPWD